MAEPATSRATGDARQRAAMADLAAEVARQLDLDAALELWDGSRLPLGSRVTRPLAIRIAAPGVIASLLRRPTLDRVVRHYALGNIDVVGGTLLDLGLPFAQGRIAAKAKDLDKGVLLRSLWPFVLERPVHPQPTRAFAGDAAGEGREKARNADFIQFHYDVGNAFYRLFLDENLLYSCAYFTDWGNTLDSAQLAKLDMICRKLRLKPGERFLDIGCGWGALVCHAAKAYGAKAHGITLSKEQLAYARERIAREGLGDQVTVELRDYQDLAGSFDKIASVGMYEHIGLANAPGYFRSIRRLLAPGGLFLNHAIARRAKRRRRRFGARAEQKALQRYIFPGGELDDIGHTLQLMERAGFAVHDVEGWREHYALTTRHWCERLAARREEAIAIVGEPTTRIWLAYLAGCSLAFTRGSALIFQVLLAGSPRGDSALPPTRADLYT